MSEIDPTADINTTPQRGRPATYSPEHHPQIARAIAMMGGTRRDIGTACEVHERTIDRWINEHDEFADAVKVGRAAADARVEDALYRRAIGYEFTEHHMEVTGEGAQKTVKRKSVKREMPPDVQAGIFWLRNRKPAQWGEKNAATEDVPANTPQAEPVAAEFDYAGLTRRIEQRYLSRSGGDVSQDRN